RQRRSPASGTIWLFPSGERIWSSFIRSVSVLWQGWTRAASGRAKDCGQFCYSDDALLAANVAVGQRPHHPLIEAVHPDAALLQTRADLLRREASGGDVKDDNVRHSGCHPERADLRQFAGQKRGIGVIVGELFRAFLKGYQTGSRQNPGLPHAATQPFSVQAGAIDELP